MIKVIYAMVNNKMPEDFVDDLFFAEGEYEIMLFDSPIIAEVNGEMQEFRSTTAFYTSPGSTFIIVQNPENFYIHGFVLTAMKHFLRKGTFRLAYLFSARISAVTENIL